MRLSYEESRECHEKSRAPQEENVFFAAPCPKEPEDANVNIEIHSNRAEGDDDGARRKYVLLICALVPGTIFRDKYIRSHML